MQPYPYGQPVFAPQPSDLRRRFGGKTIAALVITIVALVFIIISMMATWWNVDFSMTIVTSSFRAQGGYTLGGSCFTTTIPGYPAQSSCSGFASAESSLANVFQLAFVMMIIGLILTILAMVFLLIGILRPKLGMAGFVCAIIGAILILVAPIYVFAAAPGAFGGAFLGLGSLLPSGMTVSTNIPGFFGSGTISLTYMGSTFTGDLTVGGGIGWYLAFASFAMLLVAGIMIMSAARAVMPMGNYVGRPMASYGYPQQPMGQPGMAYGQPQPGYAPQPTYPSGYPYYDAPPAQPAVQPPEQPAAPASPPSPVESKCASCGALVSPGTVFCPVCGAKVG